MSPTLESGDPDPRVLPVISADDIVHITITRIQKQHPEAFIVISGDFNQASLDSAPSDVCQFINWSTRKNTTVDLRHANVRANQLNYFFNRVNIPAPAAEACQAATPWPPTWCLSVTLDQVRGQLASLHPSKTTGLDRMCHKNTQGLCFPAVAAPSTSLQTESTNISGLCIYTVCC